MTRRIITKRGLHKARQSGHGWLDFMDFVLPIVRIARSASPLLAELCRNAQLHHAGLFLSRIVSFMTPSVPFEKSK